MSWICANCGSKTRNGKPIFRLQRVIIAPDGIGCDIDEGYGDYEPYFCVKCGEKIHKENTKDHPIPPLGEVD